MDSSKPKIVESSVGHHPTGHFLPVVEHPTRSALIAGSMPTGYIHDLKHALTLGLGVKRQPGPRRVTYVAGTGGH
jgi:hypothetical protein